MKRIISISFVLAILAGLLAVPAVAAGFNVPGINEKNRVYTYCSGVHDTVNKRLWVWTDQYLKNRNQKEWVDVEQDEIQILEIYSNGVIKIKYPVKNGYKVRFTQIKAVFPNLENTEIITAQCQITTFKRADLKSKYGLIYSGDVVYCYGSIRGDVSGPVRVLYSIGNQQYKAAFISRADYSKLVSGGASTSAATTSAEDQVLARLNAMMDGSYGSGVYQLNKKYTGPLANEQCKGFAKQVHMILMGYNIGSTKTNKYQININTANTLLVGSTTSLTNQNLESLFDRAKPGDFIQVRRSHGGPHSMIFLYSDTYSDTVTVFECNSDGKMTTQKNTYSWNTFRAKNSAVSIYTAKNYYLH